MASNYEKYFKVTTQPCEAGPVQTSKVTPIPFQPGDQPIIQASKPMTSGRSKVEMYTNKPEARVSRKDA